MRTCIPLVPLLFALSDPLAAQPPPAAKSGDLALPAGAIMRLGDTRLRAGARITHLAFSPDGKQLASWGNWMYFEDRLSIWDSATGKELHTVTIGEHRIEALGWGTEQRGFAVIKAGNFDARGLDDYRIWRFTDPADKPPSFSALGPPKKMAAAPGGAESGETYGSFALAADGSRLAAFRMVGKSGGAVDLFEARACASGKQLRRIASRGKLPAVGCNGLQFLRDGRIALLVMTADKVDEAIAIWDPAKDNLSKPIAVAPPLRQGSRSCFDVAPDGSAVVVGLEDGTVKITELPSGKERLSMKKHGHTGQKGVWTAVSAVKFVNDGRQVLSAGRDGRQRVWDARTGAALVELNGHVSWVEAVAISPDGTRVATAGQDSLIRLWEARTWRPVVPTEGPRETIWRVEVSRDGRYTAAASGDGVHAWELASGREVLNRPTGRNADMLFAPTGELLTTGDKGTTLVHALAGGAGASKSLKIPGRLLEFTRDGKCLLTAEGNDLVLWDWPAGKRRGTLALGGRPTSAAVAPDSKTAVVRSENSKSATIVDLAAGKIAGELPCTLHWFSREAGFALGGRVLCGAVSLRLQAEMWDMATRSRVREFERPPFGKSRGRMFYILSFAVSAAGRRSASCQSDGSVTVYETASGQVVTHFEGHRGGAIAVNLSPEGDRVISGGADHSVLVWDASLKTLGAGARPIAAADRDKAWDVLGTQPAKAAIKTMAALAADPEGSVAWLAARLRPVRAVDGAVLDRIFRDFEDEDSDVRARASAALEGLGEGAIGGVRQRRATATSAEVRRRADQFLSRFGTARILTPDRLRIERTMEVLATVNTAAARDLVRRLAEGAAGTWVTEAAQRTHIIQKNR